MMTIRKILITLWLIFGITSTPVLADQALNRDNLLAQSPPGTIARILGEFGNLKKGEYTDLIRLDDGDIQLSRRSKLGLVYNHLEDDIAAGTATYLYQASVIHRSPKNGNALTALQVRRYHSEKYERWVRRNVRSRDKAAAVRKEFSGHSNIRESCRNLMRAYEDPKLSYHKVDQFLRGQLFSTRIAALDAEANRSGKPYASTLAAANRIAPLVQQSLNTCADTGMVCECNIKLFKFRTRDRQDASASTRPMAWYSATNTAEKMDLFVFSPNSREKIRVVNITFK